MSAPPVVDGWAVLELMGHRRMAGKLTEVLVGGTTLLRIDVPRADGSMATQLYGVGSVYCITPTTEEIAHAVALANPPEPIHPWELRPRLAAAPPATDVEVLRGAGFDAAGVEEEVHSETEVHPFVADEDQDEGTCVECGELPHDPLHAHAYVRLAGSPVELCGTCKAGPDDQVHVLDEHPYGAGDGER